LRNVVPLMWDVIMRSTCTHRHTQPTHTHNTYRCMPFRVCKVIGEKESLQQSLIARAYPHPYSILSTTLSYCYTLSKALLFSPPPHRLRSWKQQRQPKQQARVASVTCKWVGGSCAGWEWRVCVCLCLCVYVVYVFVCVSAEEEVTCEGFICSILANCFKKCSWGG